MQEEHHFLLVGLFAVVVAVMMMLFVQQQLSKPILSKHVASVRLFLVRHGQRIDQADRSWRNRSTTPTSQIYEPYLSDLGREQVLQLGHYLNHTLLFNNNNHSSSCNKHHTFIFSSPFLRCLQTSDAIARATGVQSIIVEPGIQEYHFSDRLWTREKLPQFLFDQITTPVHFYNSTRADQTTYVPAIDFEQYFVQQLINREEELDQFERRVFISLQHMIQYALHWKKNHHLHHSTTTGTMTTCIIVVTHASGVLIGANSLLQQAPSIIMGRERCKRYIPIRTGTASVTEFTSVDMGLTFSCVQNGTFHFLSSGETNPYHMRNDYCKN